MALRCRAARIPKSERPARRRGFFGCDRRIHRARQKLSRRTADYKSPMRRSRNGPRAFSPQPRRHPEAREFISSPLAFGTRCGLQGRGPQNSRGPRRFGQILLKCNSAPPAGPLALDHTITAAGAPGRTWSPRLFRSMNRRCPHPSRRPSSRGTGWTEASHHRSIES